MSEEMFVFRLKKLHQMIVQNMMKDQDVRNCPSPTQIRIINYLKEHQDEKIYQKDIENHLQISRATVSDVLNTMEKNSMVNRVTSLEDPRTKIVSINKKAIEAHKQAMKLIKVLDDKLVQNISQDDLQHFNKVIDQFIYNLENTTKK